MVSDPAPAGGSGGGSGAKEVKDALTGAVGDFVTFIYEILDRNLLDKMNQIEEKNKADLTKEVFDGK